MRSLLLVESLDLHTSTRYILVRVIPSCLQFMKMCLCQVSLLSRCIPRYFTSSSWGVAHCLYGPRGRGEVRLFHVANVTWFDLDLLAFILHF
jgi:hypothetical protein